MAPLSSSYPTLLFFFLLGVCSAEAEGAKSAQHIFHHSCALKKDAGPCKALKDRFYFDIDTGNCETFEYGGCQGNANNFETLLECEEMCLVKENKSPCHLEDEPGPCRGLVPRYFFQKKTQECQRFFYGGCFGNANNFRTLTECQARCLPGSNHMEIGAPVKPPEDALTKQDAAPSNTSHHHSQRRVSYTPEAVFTPPEFCSSPVERGDCDGTERRYVFIPRTGRCQMFHYSGCGGNKNNFLHKRMCMKMCKNDFSRRKQVRIKTRNSNILFRSV